MNNHSVDIEETPVQVIATFTQDMIHDISFDWFGRRIATSSSDKTVKIYFKNNEGKWTQQSFIKVQGGPLWRVKWARPEFGLVLATCSLDRSVKIFQRRKNEWIQQFKMADSKEGIEDIKFSPRHSMGLLLATASSDGNLRIYEAQDPNNLRNWIMKIIIPINQLGLNCLSWNKSHLQKTMLVVGCKDIKTTYKKTILGMFNENKEHLKITTNSPTVCFVIKKDEGEWPKLDFPVVETEAVNDISWSLMNGRSYHLVAFSTESFVKIYYLKINEATMKITVDRSVVLNGCGLRLSWNIMGTHLAVSEPKRIRVYKSDKFKWNQVKRIEDKSQS